MSSKALTDEVSAFRYLPQDLFLRVLLLWEEEWLYIGILVLGHLSASNEDPIAGGGAVLTAPCSLKS